MAHRAAREPIAVQRALARRARRFRWAATRALGRLRGDTSLAPVQLPYLVLVGAHHKTGSAWIGALFREICDRYGLRFFSGEQTGLPDDADVFFQRHSRFATGSLPRAYRGVHLIRDPRDVIISGCFYHEKASEPWLDEARRDLGGLTYRQALKAQPTREAKIIFEMEHVGRETIDEMLGWDRSDPSFQELRLETVASDPDAYALRPVLTFLGFPEPALAMMLAIARERSVSRAMRGRSDQSGHVRSGVPGEWRTHFTQPLAARFESLYGSALVTLGYEVDGGWVDALSG